MTPTFQHRLTLGFASNFLRPPGQNSRWLQTTGGFTLLELLAVIAILGILATAALPRFDAFRAAAYDARAQQDLRNLASAQELYRASHDGYAAAIEDIVAYVASDGVEVSIESADTAGFTAVSRHEAGSQRFAWDSAARPALSATPD